MLSQLREAIKEGREPEALKLIKIIPVEELLKEVDGKEGTSALDLAFLEGMNAVIGAIITRNPPNLYQNHSIGIVARIPVVRAAIEAVRDPQNVGAQVSIDTSLMKVLISRGALSEDQKTQRR